MIRGMLTEEELKNVAQELALIAYGDDVYDILGMVMEHSPLGLAVIVSTVIDNYLLYRGIDAGLADKFYEELAITAKSVHFDLNKEFGVKF